VLFMSHEYLFQPSERFPKPGLIVLDESIFPALVAQPRAISAEDFIHLAGPYKKLAQLIVLSLRDGQPLKAALTAAGYTAGKLKRAAANLRRRTPPITPGMEDGALEAALCKAPNHRLAIAAFASISKEMRLSREEVYSVTARSTVTGQMEILLQWRRIPRLPRSVPW
jgi:hypothetical protein